MPVTLRVTRQDGYSQVVDRTVVYLVRTGEQDVRAMQSTCTHLGCRTAYDRKIQAHPLPLPRRRLRLAGQRRRWPAAGAAADA